MGVDVVRDRWPVARQALGETAGRFAELVTDAPRLQGHAVGGWSAIEAAAHVVAIGRMYQAIARDEPIPIKGLQAAFAGVTMANLHEFNELTLAEFTQREPAALAERLTADVADMLAATEGDDPARAVVWLGDSRVPLTALFSHLVNEMLVHGWDVARAAGQPWRIPARDAALFTEVFVVSILRYGIGRLYEPYWQSSSMRRVAVEFRSAHAEPYRLVWDSGRMVADEPGPDTDVRVVYDPATLNLVLFRRMSKARAVLTRGIIIRGPRPWLLPGFLRVMRLP